MGIQFVRPDTVRLLLSDGDFVLVKKRLTAGERDEMMARMMPTMIPGETLHVNSKGVRAAKVLAYLLGWSSPVAMSPQLSDDERAATVNGLDPNSFDEISTAIDAHEAAIEKEIAARKNGLGTPSVSAETSTCAA